MNVRSKLVWLSVCLMIAVSSLFMAAWPHITANAAESTGWKLATEKNCVLEEKDGIADIRETVSSTSREVIDVITNTEGYDVTKAVEFDMYLNNLPFDEASVTNPVSTDYWIGLFLTTEYTEQFYTVQDANGTLNFNLYGVKNENGSSLTGRYALPDGRVGTWNDERVYSGTDNKVTVRFEIGENYTVVYRKTEKTQEYVEWFFIPDIGRDFFSEGKVYFNMRFYVATAAVNPELIDIGLSEVRNTEEIGTGEADTFKYGENVDVSQTGEQTTVSVNGASGWMYYRVPVSVANKVEIKFTLDNIPGYHDDGVDAWFGMFLSDTATAHSASTNDAYGLLVRPKNSAQIGGDVLALSPNGQTLTAALREGDNSVVFEMQKSVLNIWLNDACYALDLDAEYFVGQKGYISFYAHNSVYTGEENRFTVSYEIINEEPVIMPQIFMTDGEEPYSVRQQESLTVSYGGDVFVSISGNNITANDYVADAEKKTVTLKADYLNFLPTEEVLAFTVHGKQSDCTFEVKVTAVEGVVQIITLGREFVYDKGSDEGLTIAVRGDEFVSVSGNSITEADYEFAETEEMQGALTVAQAYFLRLRTGTYSYVIEGAQSSVEFSVTVQGSTAEKLQIVLAAEEGTFDGLNPADIEIVSVQGAPVNVVGNVIMSGDFRCGAGTIILTKEYLQTLENGTYVYRIYEVEGTSTEFTLTVVNAQTEEEPTPPTDKEPEDGQEKTGCSSSFAGIHAAAAVCASMVAAAALLKRKKKENK